MSLNDFNFILYFIVLVLLMLLIQAIQSTFNKEFVRRTQLVLLVAFSYFFVFQLNWRFCICILLVSIIAYICSVGIARSNNKKIKLRYLLGGIMLLIMMLGYFKYANFFVNSIVSTVIKQDVVLINVMLPIGISFYIFSALAYLIDIYWERYQAEENFMDFALYISFFPKLTAGPIIRGKDMLPQIKNYNGIRLKGLEEGIQIFVFGLFKKIVLADNLGVFVDDVFYAPSAYNTFTVIWAAITYSLQIYFDFSGYSDMAIGTSKMLGFDFARNFNLPYLAQNISDFWKRWHISLSSWFQEYLYIPLGGSRRGTGRTCFNLMAVMLISGIWHGAGWTFMVWGMLYGVANVICFLWKKRGYKEKAGIISKLVNLMVTFSVVTIFWVVFRAETIGKAMSVWKGIFTIHSGITQMYSWTFFAIGCLAVGSIAAAIRAKKNKKEQIDGFYPIMDLTKISSLIVFFTFTGLTVIMAYFGNNAFIYGKF